MEEKYLTFIDSKEFQIKILEYIGSEEFDVNFNSTIFSDKPECRMAMIYGMCHAGLLTSRCEHSLTLYPMEQKQSSENKNIKDNRCIRICDLKQRVQSHPEIGTYVSEEDIDLAERVFYSDKVQSKYKVITLCGSTKFKDEFMEVQKKLTLKGYIVISVGLFGHSGDNEVWTEGKKEMLDDMHRRKIDMADEIFVINVGGYIGKSTKSEIEYAKSKGLKINYYENID